MISNEGVATGSVVETLVLAPGAAHTQNLGPCSCAATDARRTARPTNSPRFARAQGNTPWLKVLKTLVAYRLIDPGSEWRLHRQWFDASAMADLLDSDFALAEKNTLYRCLDRLLEHKDDLFKFLLG